MANDLPTSEQNTGHGWVYPRPDGVKARCGGPALCQQCARDDARLKAAQERHVTIPVSVALLIRQAFLPANPNKMRNAHPDVVAAAKRFIAAVEEL